MALTIEKTYPNYTRLKSGGLNTLNNLAFSTGLIISATALPTEDTNFPASNIKISSGLRHTHKTVSTTLELIDLISWSQETFDQFNTTIKPKYISEVIIRAKIRKVDVSLPKIFIY
jgi:hypothetical protein